MVPIVSIILPTYNRARLIGRSINSVLLQTFHDFELIVVDDASTDNSEDVIKELSDPRLRYIRHEMNRGGAAARNTGIQAAAGNFIGFQDSDDEWLPEKLAKQIQAFHTSSQETGVVYSGCNRIDGLKKTYIPSPGINPKRGKLHSRLLAGNFITLPSLLVKKECLEKVGVFDERLLRLHDWDLFIRIARHYDFAFIDEPLLISYFTSESISSKEDSLLEACEIILDKHHDDLIKNKKIISSHQYFLGDRSVKSGNRQKGITFLCEAFKNNPRPGLLLAIVAALFGQTVYRKYSALAHMLIPGNAAAALTEEGS